MEPCGTPDVTVAHSDPMPLITTLCARLVRKAFIHVRSGPLMPMLSSLSRSLQWGTESNALAKSRNTMCIEELLFSDSAQ